MKTIYLDNAATTKTAPEVLDTINSFNDESYGNPSSLHHLGRLSKKALDFARINIANKLNAAASEIIFTSGGTEANNLAIFGICNSRKDKGNHIITSKFEHPSVLQSFEQLKKQGFEVDLVNITEEGIVDLDHLKSLLKPKTIFVSIMHANNEVGTIQPIKEIAAICKQTKFSENQNIIFHSDCVQSFTKLPLDVKELGVDLISISSHKIHGPKGVGALYIRKLLPLTPILFGGSQEKLKRAGTENIAGIVGFAKAIELITDKDIKKMSELRDYLIEELLKISDTKLNGSQNLRLCNNISVVFNFIEGESLLMHLDLEGICVSTGSACSSMDLQASHVLLSLGLPHEQCHGTIRFTLSKYTTKEELDITVKKIKKTVEDLRKISPFKDFKSYESIKGDNHVH
ncbi:cysteine desulfurase [Candidatus Woesearchaeota archaeon]|nr:cysteine desulfurase [Candidatus Woesearchaeota archaeon]